MLKSEMLSVILVKTLLESEFQIQSSKNHPLDLHRENVDLARGRAFGDSHNQ